MLFAQIEDFVSPLEIIVFPETLTKTEAVWKENSAVLVLGKMSRRNGEAKFICEDARTL